MEYGVRIILKDAGDLSQVLRIKVPGTLKALIIYQDYSAAICNIIPWTSIEFETLHVGNSLLQIIIKVG